MARLRTAFVYLHAQAGPDFFADVPFAWTAGELRALGLPADVVHVHFERDQPALQLDLVRQLIELVRDGGYGLVVLEHCWLPELVAQLQSGADALVCETEPFAVHPATRVDFVLHHFTDNRQPLVELVQALDDGTPAGDVDLRNVDVHAADQPLRRARHRQAHPPEPDARRPFCPVVDRITLGNPVDERGEQHPARKTLDTNKGCPFSDKVSDNPAFANVPLQAPGITLAGCAFCPMGGDYVALPWREAVQVHLDQIAYYQRHMPRLDEVVLRDQHAVRYAAELIRGAQERGLRPFGLLVPGRGDAVLRFGEAMARATKAAAGTGWWWSIYLVGFESFSQPQLDLYNKGVTVEQYVQALRQMRALHAEEPDSFRLYAAGASSFILFSPWTTLDDLRANVDFCRQHSVWRLARGLTTTRMRLYPNLPLYHRALADGLLERGSQHDDRGAAHTGYAAEAGWRYADPRVGLVEELHERLRRHCKVDELVGLLDACERHARAGGAADVDAIERQWLALRGLWRSGEAQVSATALDAGARRERAHAVARKADRTVLAGRNCNNNCRTCVADHAHHDDHAQRLAERVAVAAGGGRVTIAGREPLMLAALPTLLKRAKAAHGATNTARVELVSNGRMIAAPGVAAKLRRGAVTDLLLKRHRLRDTDEDTFCRTEGAGRQLWTGVARLAQEASNVRWRLLLVVTREGLDELDEIAAKAMASGASGVQLKVMAGELELAELAQAHDKIASFLQSFEAPIEGF